MMQPLWSDEARRAIGEIAQRHGFGEDAGLAMAAALDAGGGWMAQFGHPELGGMGQWSRGGMLMIGDMFNHNLKGRVAGLAEDLAAALANGAIAPQRPAPGQSSAGFGTWWPEELGQPSATGAQNGRRYAVFPGRRRLAIERDGRVRVYDTGDHRIGGAGQQQGGGESLSFSTDRGSIGVHDLQEIGAPIQAAPERAPEPSPAAWTAPSSASDEPWSAPQEPVSQPEPPRASAPSSGAEAADPIELIRKLAALKDAGVLTDDEFQAKKTELLGRI